MSARRHMLEAAGKAGRKNFAQLQDRGLPRAALAFLQAMGPGRTPGGTEKARTRAMEGSGAGSGWERRIPDEGGCGRDRHERRQLTPIGGRGESQNGSRGADEERGSATAARPGRAEVTELRA